MAEKVEVVVSDEFIGERLDVAVSKITARSRSQIQRAMREAGFKPSMKVREAMNLELSFHDEEKEATLEPEPVNFEVLYEDADIIIIDKPAPLVVHPAVGHWYGTLVHGLVYRYPELADSDMRRPGIVHRLDAGTSGLMVIARNLFSKQKLTDAFKARSVKKEYLALVYGSPNKEKGTIASPIGRHPKNRLKMAVVSGGREAVTEYEVLWSNDKFSFLRCTIHTGRTHQIRVHLKDMGCPIVGDRLYGCNLKAEWVPKDRFFLHAWKLAFPHPRDGRIMSFRSFLPLELKKALLGARTTN
ncbi:RluA family pseudouridine synthase [Acetomicrobium hydrogeniformans]|jgi:23S rRNA pseudouridine1911/1915/1917 synthase|uniref:Pseudouridine synthase n=1 Tax=Acetomicrobium hydrogeniformans ATCC BAA-1850 TaxID=592015 RepID=A0A0T5XDD3_9BACT|nr:RluA family pseudouridine synthase [Acetomicrobium hydrogeniformans]KRT36260.1 pseudouridine synthase, RluA family [Acetomicrobium hydrogeniformans ATCC BAA-1850]